MKILRFKKITSTNQKAKELAKKGFQPWSVILAKEQTSGYGRKGDFWYSPKGGLYFSIILPQIQIEDLQTLTLLAAFVVAKIIKDHFFLQPLIKLPNDILINNKKIAGILTENIISGEKVKSSIMGIGLNTNLEKFPKDLENKATSLKIELGKEVDNQKILKEIIKGLKEQFKNIIQ
jgi:BirA family biotin operon repressor/biotin-[acetyl-CoA-carboxylase] ligase